MLPPAEMAEAERDVAGIEHQEPVAPLGIGREAA